NDDAYVGRRTSVTRSAMHENLPASDSAGHNLGSIVPVILSGGLGARLWPLSRANMPKQVLRLWGTDPMIAATARRLTGFTDEAPIAVCSDDQQFLVADALARQGLPLGALVLEPIGRNTAPAIAVAALKASAISPDVLLVVQPSDHVVTDIPAFRS